MDLEEQQGFIENITPAKPIKQVRKVKYIKSSSINYLIAILVLIILGLMLYIVIDITGQDIIHLSFKSTKNQQNTTQMQNQNQDQSEIDTMDYSSQIDNLLWDDSNNYVDNQKVETEVYIDQNIGQSEEISQTEEPQQLIQNSEVQIFQSATFDFGNSQEIQDQQYEQYSLLQSGSSIITPKIDDQKYNYIELPNKMKILLIQNDDENAQIYLNIFQGYWQTNYFVRCDQCQITVQEQQTQYFISTKSNDILSSFTELSKLFASENPQLELINYEKSSLEELLSQISNEKHPLSSKFRKSSSFQLSPNQIVLIIKGKFDQDALMEGIVQSDIVLLRDKDIQEIENIQIISNPGSIIKWNNQKDLNSVKMIYELQDSRELNFLDYFIQTSLQNYIINRKLGLDVKSSLILNENNKQLYQIQISLPFQDQMNYDQRESAYRLSKIISNFANSLQTKLLTKDNQLSEYCIQMIDQLQQINNLQFDYDNKEYNYMNIAKNINSDLIGEMLHYKFSIQIAPESLKKTLDNLQSTKNLIIIVSGSQYHTEYNFLQISKGSATQDLLFLTQDELDINQNGIQYSLKQITDQTKQFIEKTDEDIIFDFPQINNYIPQNLELVEQIKRLS